MNPEFQKFLDRCDALTPATSKLSRALELAVQRAHIGCWIPGREKATAYQDDQILIVRSLDSKAMVVEKVENQNPVVGRNREGEIFRYHGEWQDLEEHVRRLCHG